MPFLGLSGCSQSTRDVSYCYSSHLSHDLLSKPSKRKVSNICLAVAAKCSLAEAEPATLANGSLPLPPPPTERRRLRLGSCCFRFFSAFRQPFVPSTAIWVSANSSLNCRLTCQPSLILWKWKVPYIDAPVWLQTVFRKLWRQVYRGNAGFGLQSEGVINVGYVIQIQRRRRQLTVDLPIWVVDSVHRRRMSGMARRTTPS